MEGKPIGEREISQKDPAKGKPVGGIREGKDLWERGDGRKKGHKKKETKQERTKIGVERFFIFESQFHGKKGVTVVASNINTILLP